MRWSWRSDFGQLISFSPANIAAFSPLSSSCSAIGRRHRRCPYRQRAEVTTSRWLLTPTTGTFLSRISSLANVISISIHTRTSTRSSRCTIPTCPIKHTSRRSRHTCTTAIRRSSDTEQSGRTRPLLVRERLSISLLRLPLSVRSPIRHIAVLSPIHRTGWQQLDPARTRQPRRVKEAPLPTPSSSRTIITNCKPMRFTSSNTLSRCHRCPTALRPDRLFRSSMVSSKRIHP